MDVDKDENEKTKQPLGVDKFLDAPGDDAQKTEDREEAKRIIEEDKWLNARQLMMRHKKGHGAGISPDVPTKQAIQEHMAGQEADYMVPVYGDGSHTSPTKWWAAIGGFGVWIPKWGNGTDDDDRYQEKDLCGPALGQAGSSTRHELMGWMSV